MKKILDVVVIFFFIVFFIIAIRHVHKERIESNERKKKILRLENEKLNLEILVLKKECCC